MKIVIGITITITSLLIVGMISQIHAEVYPYFSMEDYKKILDYCWDRADRVAKGENVLTDLVNASFVPSWFENKTCLDVQDEYVEYLNNHGLNQ